MSTETPPAKIPLDASGPTFVQQNLQANQFNIFVNWPMSQPAAPIPKAIEVVCPHCRKKTMSPAGWGDGGGFALRCQHCMTDFLAQLFVVSAESSARSPTNTIYSIRGAAPWTTYPVNLVQFAGGGYQDFELRPGDSAAFLYIGSAVRAVVNFTIKAHWFVTPRVRQVEQK